MKKITTILMALIAVLFISVSCDKEEEVVENKNVMIMYDDSTDNVNTVSLKVALEAAGFEVTFSDENEANWDNTNPSLDKFFAVIHFNGTTYDNAMSEAAQLALVDFVKNKGGFYVQAEWDGYEIEEGRMTAMQDLVLIDRGSASEGNLTFTVVTAQASHAVLKGIPASYTMNSAVTNGAAHVFAESPSVVLVTENTRDAVVVREFGKGKILGFNHAGNYEGAAHWSNSNIQKMIINFLNWTE